MYDTQRGAFQEAGPCPASHPVRVPQVAYETLWDTAQFANMWPKDGSNPFFLSYGDNKGYGTHADYLFGWKGDSLQRAMGKTSPVRKMYYATNTLYRQQLHVQRLRERQTAQEPGCASHERLCRQERH